MKPSHTEYKIHCSFIFLSRVSAVFQLYIHEDEIERLLQNLIIWLLLSSVAILKIDIRRNITLKKETIGFNIN